MLHTHKKISWLIPLLFILVVTLSTSAYSEPTCTPMTESEKQNYAKDTIGMAGGGIAIEECVYNESLPEFLFGETYLSFFNTKNESVLIQLTVTPFNEDRVHTVKPNYVFYRLPNASWIAIPPMIDIAPNSKFTFDVDYKIPVDVAEETPGGFIFKVTGEHIQYKEGGGTESLSLVGSQKVFLVLPKDSLPITTPVLTFFISLSLIGFVIVYEATSKIRKKVKNSSK